MTDWPSMDGEEMMPLDDSLWECDFGEVEGGIAPVEEPPSNDA